MVVPEPYCAFLLGPFTSCCPWLGARAAQGPTDQLQSAAHRRFTLSRRLSVPNGVGGPIAGILQPFRLPQPAQSISASTHPPSGSLFPECLPLGDGPLPISAAPRHCFSLLSGLCDAKRRCPHGAWRPMNRRRSQWRCGSVPATPSWWAGDVRPPGSWRRGEGG